MVFHVGAIDDFRSSPGPGPGTYQYWLFYVHMDVGSVAGLVASFVSLVVFVFAKVPLPEVVPVMRFVILAFALPLLVPAVFRIILVGARGIHCRKSHRARRASNDAYSYNYCQNPGIWFEIDSHTSSPSAFPPPSATLVFPDDEATFFILARNACVDSILLIGLVKTAQ
jgi:hypothetical protein